MGLKTIIIDDEPLARDLIKNYVEQVPALELVGSYPSALEAVKAVVGGEVDLIFLDINMPCVDGIELAQITPSTTRIVYVTAYEQYAVQAFSANALDYLLKPVSFPDFMRSVRRALEWKKREDAYHEALHTIRNFIVVKSDYKTVQINLDNILYIEGRRDYVTFVLDCEPYKIVSLINLKKLATSLPSDKFMRVHRSYIVNLDKITVIDRARIVFGDLFIPISEGFKDRFSDYLRLHSVLGVAMLEPGNTRDLGPIS